MRHVKNKSLIVYQDDSIIAANKPARLASVPADNIGLGSTLLGRVRREAARTMGEKSQSVYPLHRLDYATSGIVLFGKNLKEKKIFETIHRHPETVKIYLALVEGYPQAKGIINFPVPARHQDVWVSAHTEYLVLAQSSEPKCSLTKIKIATGRRHQIRRHFAMIKFPIVLDDEYGNKKFNWRFRRKFRLSRHFLHAWKILFVHPITGEYLNLTAPLAPDLALTLKQLDIPLPIA